jgi:hypothetical protein
MEVCMQDEEVEILFSTNCIVWVGMLAKLEEEKEELEIELVTVETWREVEFDVQEDQERD